MGVVRASRNIRSASWALEIHTFLPEDQGSRHRPCGGRKSRCGVGVGAGVPARSPAKETLQVTAGRTGQEPALPVPPCRVSMIDLKAEGLADVDSGCNPFHAPRPEAAISCSTIAASVTPQGRRAPYSSGIREAEAIRRATIAAVELPGELVVLVAPASSTRQGKLRADSCGRHMADLIVDGVGWRKSIPAPIRPREYKGSSRPQAYSF